MTAAQPEFSSLLQSPGLPQLLTSSRVVDTQPQPLPVMKHHSPRAQQLKLSHLKPSLASEPGQIDCPDRVARAKPEMGVHSQLTGTLIVLYCPLSWVAAQLCPGRENCLLHLPWGAAPASTATPPSPDLSLFCWSQQNLVLHLFFPLCLTSTAMLVCCKSPSACS